MLNSINFIFDVSYDWNACFDKVYDFISENNRLPLRSSLDQNEHQNAIWLKS